MDKHTYYAMAGNPLKHQVQTFRAMTPNHRFAARVKPKSSETIVGELFIYDAIGDSWFGGVSSKDVIRAIKDIEAAGATQLDVRINSPGGDVFEAAAIYQAIRRFDGKRHCYVDALAASAASYIAMAGDTIYTAFNAMWMIHWPWGVVVGNANDLRRTADDLDKIGGTMLEVYQKRSKMDKDELCACLDAETWWTAEEAKEHGFTDEVVDNHKDDDDEDEDEEHEHEMSASAVSILAKYGKTPPKMRPTGKAMVASMEQRLMDHKKRASPLQNPGQPGKVK